MTKNVARALAVIVMLPEAKKKIVETNDGRSRFVTKQEAVREALEWADTLVEELYKKEVNYEA